MVLLYTVKGGKIMAMEAIAQPERLAALEIALLD